jgi:hypothetical protein
LVRVSAIAIPGLDLWFNTSDHLPPHFHARKPGLWEVRVYFLTSSADRLDYQVKWPRGRRDPGRRERKAILQATLRHRVELLEEWERKVPARERG